MKRVFSSLKNYFLSVVKNPYFYIWSVLWGGIFCLNYGFFNLYFSDFTLMYFLNPALYLVSLLLLNTILKPTGVIKLVLGDFNYQTPGWIKKVSSKEGKEKSAGLLKNKKVIFSVLGLALISTGVGLFIKFRPPEPVKMKVTATIYKPDVTEFYTDAKGALQKEISSLEIRFSENAAPLKDIGKEISKGVDLKPNLKGTWKWGSENELQFKPEKPWPLGKEFYIDLQRNLIAPQYEIESRELKFETKKFHIEVSNSEFYENPENPKERKTIFTLKFNYPVDEKTLYDRIRLEQTNYDKNISKSKKKLDFNLIMDDQSYKYKAYIHSSNVDIPKHEGEVDLVLSAGVSPEIENSPTEEDVTDRVRLPGLYNYFHFKDSYVYVVEDEKGIPEHILTLQSSTGITPKEVAKNIEVYLLPAYKKESDDYQTNWKSEKHTIDAGQLGKSLKIEVTPVASAETYPKYFNFKLQVPVDRYLAIKIKKGMKSASNFELPTDSLHVAHIPTFPKTVKIMQPGSILRMKGERKLSIYSINIPKLEISIGQVIENQVQHIITQSYGNVLKPSFSYSFNEENLSHFTKTQRQVSDFSETKPSYNVIDFNQLMNKKLNGKKLKGLFFVKIRGLSLNDSFLADDQRFIIVTDLGVQLKKSIDGSQSVFVQSIENGGPIEGVDVEVFGRNGLPLLTQKTNSQGKVDFPKVETIDNNSPYGFIIRQGNDLAFLQYHDYNRMLNYSRFDISGAKNSKNTGKIEAYLFSDRGMYRPGENVRIGYVAKSDVWGKSLKGVPVEIDVLNARRKKIHTFKQVLSEKGLGDITFDLNRNDPTGTYSLKLYNIKERQYRSRRGVHRSVQDRILLGSLSFEVQEFVPDKLKIRTSIIPSKTKGWIKPDEIKASLNLKNLFGFPAAGHDVRGKIFIESVYLRFGKYSDYRFDNPTKDLKNYEGEWVKQTTDDKGDSEFKLDLDKFSKKVYRLVFLGEGFEKESGRSVLGQSFSLVSPYDYLVGVKAEGDFNYIKRDDERTIKFIAIDADLNQVSASKLSLELVELKYINVLTKRPNGTFGYEYSLKKSIISKTLFEIGQDGFNYQLPTDKSGEFKIQVKNEEDLVLAEVSYSVMGNRDIARSLNRNAELQAKLNKTDYEEGEEIEMEIRAPYIGSGLITIEKDKVYSHQWFRMTEKTKTISLKVPKGLEGNAYVNISLARDINSPEIYTSPLSYGVFPFTISKEKKIENIYLEYDEVAKPGKDYNIKYKTDNESEIVLFAINEGILQFAKYKNPKPLDFFLTKKELSVKTFQLLDLVLPDLAQFKNQLAPGGGFGKGAASQLNPFSRKLKDPVAYWSGVLSSSSEQKDWSFFIPGDFNGTLRILAVAVSKNRMGTKVDKGIVRADLIINPSVPTFATPGDLFEIPINVFNNIETANDPVDIKVNVTPSEQFLIEGDSSKNLKLVFAKEATSNFTIKGGNKLGGGKVSIKASSGEFSNFIEENLSLRPSSPYNTQFKFGSLRDDDIEIPMDRKVYEEYAIRTISVAPTPLAYAGALQKFLSKSVYGCTEQLLSRAMPHLLNKTELLKPNSKSYSLIQKALSMIYARTSGEGEVYTYPGSRGGRIFMNLYAFHFLLEARERGFPVSQDIIGNIASFLKDKLNDFNYHHERAYALYLLARSGQVVTPFLIRQKKTIEELQRFVQNGKNIERAHLALAYYASTYHYLKNTKEAVKLIDEVEILKLEKFDYYSYYSQITRDTQIIYLFSRYFPKKAKEIESKQLIDVFKNLNKSYNSLNSAYTLLALDAFNKYFSAQNVEVKVSQAEKKGDNLVWTPLENFSPDGTEKNLSPSSEKIKILNDKDVPVFYAFQLSGFDKGKVKKVSSQIEVIKEVLDEKGNPVEKIVQGHNLTVIVKYRTTVQKTLSDTAVVDLFPAGFEFIHETPKYEAKNHLPEYVDIREDRLLSYSSVGNEMQEIRYKLKATNIGKFSLPATLIEDMYDLGNRALSDEKTIEVIAP